MDNLHFIKKEPLLVIEDSQNDNRPFLVQMTKQSSTISKPLRTEMSSIKTEPCSSSSSAALYTVPSIHESSSPVQSPNKMVVTNRKYVDILSKSPQKVSNQMAQNKNWMLPNSKTVLNKYRPLSSKLSIPNVAIPKGKRKRRLKDTNSTQTVNNDHVVVTTDLPANSFKPMSDAKVALPFFQQRTSGKERPMGSATIFAINKPHSLPQPNSLQSSIFQQNIQQNSGSSAAVLSSSNQQNLLHQNQISQTTNLFQTHSVTVPVLSKNHPQNIFQQNSVLLSSNPENTNQLKMGTATVLTPNSQPNLSVSQNSDRHIQMNMATMLSQNQQQNTNQQHKIGRATMLSPNRQPNISISQNLNHKLQMGTPVVLSSNQQHNLTVPQNLNQPVKMETATILFPSQQHNLTVSHNTNQQLKMGTATILLPNQQHNLTVSQNPNQQVKMETATILLPNQQHNLTLSQNPNQQVKMDTATILLPNQQHNLTLSQNPNQQVKMETAKILFPNQQRNLTLSQNPNQQVKISPLLSSNIFSAQTGLPNALQQIPVPAVIQQPCSASGISGFIIPTGSAFIPSSALVHPPANQQVELVQLHSLPVVSTVPVCQNVQTGIQIAHNMVTVPFVNQNGSSGISTLQPGLGLPSTFPGSCNTIVKCINAHLETQHAASVADGAVLHENKNSNQNQNTGFLLPSQNSQGNQAIALQHTKNQANRNHLFKLNQPADASNSKPSNIQKVMLLQDVDQPVVANSVKIAQNDQISKLDVPYIETLPSGQQIIRNLNPIDMTCISGLSVPLLPKLPPIDAQDSDVSRCKNENKLLMSSLPITSKSFEMLTRTNFPESTSSEVRQRILGNTRKYSLYYSSQKEAQLDFHNNSDNQKYLLPNYSLSTQDNSKVCGPLVTSPTSITLLPVPSLMQSHNFIKPNIQNCQTERLQDVYGNDRSVDIKAELDSCQGVSDSQRDNRQNCKTFIMATAEDVCFRKEKQRETLPSSVTNMSGISKTKDSFQPGLCFSKQKKYDCFLGMQFAPKMESSDIEHDKREQIRSNSCHHAPACYHRKQIVNTQVPCVPIQPNPKHKNDRVVDRNLVLNKIKLVKRNINQFRLAHMLKRHKKISPSELSITPKYLIKTDVLKKVIFSDGSSLPLKKKVRYMYDVSGLEFNTSTDKNIHQEGCVKDNETKMKCQNLAQSTQMSITNEELIVFKEEMTVDDDSVQIKIDSVFSLNEESDACFLASKSPHHTDSCNMLKEHKLDACFVVIEKETHSRFAALQQKVSQLRPKRACSKQCRAQALQKMCHTCYFSPVLVKR